MRALVTGFVPPPRSQSQVEEQERPQPAPQCHHNVNCLVLDACTICSTVRCWWQQHYLYDFFHNLKNRDDDNVLHLETIHELFLYMANARGTNRIMSISFKMSHQHVHKMFAARFVEKSKLHRSYRTKAGLRNPSVTQNKHFIETKKKHKKELSGKMAFPRLPHCACMRNTLVPPFSMWLRKSRASQQCKRAIATPRQQRHGVSRRAGGNFADLRSLNLI